MTAIDRPTISLTLTNPKDLDDVQTWADLAVVALAFPPSSRVDLGIVGGQHLSVVAYLSQVGVSDTQED